MKTFNLFIVMFVFFIPYTIGQSLFQKGYIIDNQGDRRECLIKNMDWAHTPKEFRYKLTEIDAEQKGTLETIKEFGFTGGKKFVKANVQIDISSDVFNNLDSEMAPKWEQAELFLEVLVEGKANLYYFDDSEKQRFFYSVNNSSPVQLIHKDYASSYRVLSNDAFRQQLLSDVNCKSITVVATGKLKYQTKELVRYFKTYNSENGYSYSEPVNKPKRNPFHVTLCPGVDFSSLQITDHVQYDINSKQQANFRMGVAFEYVLPFVREKWSFVFEPTYQSFRKTLVADQNMFLYTIEDRTVNINYSSIDIPVGLRYYFNVASGFRIFVNGFINPPANLKLKKEIIVGSKNMDMTTSISYAIGGGLTWNRIFAEVRYTSPQDLLTDYLQFSSKYKKVSFIVGLKLF